MNKYPAFKEVSTECLQKTVSYKMIVKYINHANFTSNLYVIYIKLAHNTKQSRRLVLVLENDCLIWFFTSHQQSFSQTGTGLPGFNQY